ncbi:RrF2 family transcriptional regulator [Elusimicrobiota bacterium]
MKLTTKGRYAVRCMLHLALNNSGRTVPVSKIAQHDTISSNYVEQLFLMLNKKGLIESVRGRNGGYRLAEKPENISMAKIIEVVEGPIVTVECSSEKKKCKRYSSCDTKYLWEAVSERVKNVLDDINLKDLCCMLNDGVKGETVN